MRGWLLGFEGMYLLVITASAYAFWKIHPCLAARILQPVGGEAGISAQSLPPLHPLIIFPAVRHL